MTAPARLKWCKDGEKFFAFPMGSHVRTRYAAIWKSGSGYNTDTTPHRAYEHWGWSANWEGWFAVNGYAEGKQQAADRATEEWWKAVDTELPRNMALEAEMVVARVLVRPMPNSLLGEDASFLQSVMWHLKNVYGDEIRHDTMPEPVKLMVDRLSDELLVRRQAGEYKEPEPYVPSTPRRRRRR